MKNSWRRNANNLSIRCYLGSLNLLVLEFPSRHLWYQIFSVLIICCPRTQIGYNVSYKWMFHTISRGNHGNYNKWKNIAPVVNEWLEFLEGRSATRGNTTASDLIGRLISLLLFSLSLLFTGWHGHGRRRRLCWNIQEVDYVGLQFARIESYLNSHRQQIFVCPTFSVKFKIQFMWRTNSYQS